MKRLTKYYSCENANKILDALGIDHNLSTEEVQIINCENELCKETCERVDNCEECPINEAIKKLADYEDAEEQGLLLRLPCKENTEFFLIDYPNYHFKLKEYRFCGTQVVMVIECFEMESTCKRMLSDFGNSVFLTKEEAEAALKKMQEGENNDE